MYVPFKICNKRFNPQLTVYCLKVEPQARRGVTKTEVRLREPYKIVQ